MPLMNDICRHFSNFFEFHMIPAVFFKMLSKMLKWTMHTSFKTIKSIFSDERNLWKNSSQSYDKCRSLNPPMILCICEVWSYVLQHIIADAHTHTSIHTHSQYCIKDYIVSARRQINDWSFITPPSIWLAVHYTIINMIDLHWFTWK